nr:MAG TPA: hypothetical protein [Caudoviricetes sp.]
MDPRVKPAHNAQGVLRVRVPHNEVHVLKNTNQTIASTNPAAMVLTVSNARTEGPRSACRASIGVSTIRRWPSMCSTFAMTTSFI